MGGHKVKSCVPNFRVTQNAMIRCNEINYHRQNIDVDVDREKHWLTLKEIAIFFNFNNLNGGPQGQVLRSKFWHDAKHNDRTLRIQFLWVRCVLDDNLMVTPFAFNRNYKIYSLVLNCCIGHRFKSCISHFDAKHNKGGLCEGDYMAAWS